MVPASIWFVVVVVEDAGFAIYTDQATSPSSGYEL